MKLLLASNSPRRKELLTALGYRFDVVAISCEEQYPASLETKNIAAYLAELKSNSFRDLAADEVLITADTIVAIEDEVLGKPKDQQEAKEMLAKLSGITHQVFTGITIRNHHKTVTLSDVTLVTIAQLTHLEIDWYINNFQPLDKAGSYGVQEWLGMAKISKIEGSFYTVMGLPTHLLYAVLKEFGAELQKN